MSIPQNIHFGGSSWNYPGWKGSVYKDTYKSDRDFKARSLAEYARYPFFSTVGIDSFFYTPPTVKTLQSYAALVPSNFKWVSKVWERITIAQYPSHARYGKNANLPNSDFLNAELFIDRVLTPYREAQVQAHTGPFVFQFPILRLSKSDFASKLAHFLQQLPSDFQYAVEIRNRDYLDAAYFKALNDSNTTHCFNHWQHMPALQLQMRAAANAGGLSAAFFVARLLTPLGVSYEQAVNRFSPYDTIKQPNLEMRRDVVRLVRRAIARGCEAYIIVNNRCEGNSPTTIAEICGLLSEEK